MAKRGKKRADVRTRFKSGTSKAKQRGRKGGRKSRPSKR